MVLLLFTTYIKGNILTNIFSNAASKLLSVCGVLIDISLILGLAVLAGLDMVLVLVGVVLVVLVDVVVVGGGAVVALLLLVLLSLLLLLDGGFEDKLERFILLGLDTLYFSEIDAISFPHSSYCC